MDSADSGDEAVQQNSDENKKRALLAGFLARCMSEFASSFHNVRLLPYLEILETDMVGELDFETGKLQAACISYHTGVG